MDIVIRAAEPADLPRLGEIAAAAKRHWGYPPGWLAAWRAQLTITPAHLTSWHVRVAAHADGAPLGFAAIAPASPRWMLEHLWVDPGALGQGIGRLLVRDALRAAQAGGSAGLMIEADPHAAGFYLRCGASRAGAIAAAMPGAPDRTLPIFWLDEEVS